MREAVSAQVAIGRPEASRGRPLYRLLFDAIRYYLVLLFFAIGMVLFLAGIVTCTIAGSREWRGRATRYDRAEIVQSLVFACPPGDTCSEVRRVLFNECPRYDTNGANDEIKDSPRCINLWRGTAEKISGEAE